MSDHARTTVGGTCSGWWIMFRFLRRRKTSETESSVSNEPQSDTSDAPPRPDPPADPAEPTDNTGDNAELPEPPGDVPDWLLRPLPVNAVVDESLLADLDACRDLGRLLGSLTSLSATRSYDAAVNRANSRVWHDFANGTGLVQTDLDREVLVSYAAQHMTPRARARILRRLAKDSRVRVRRAVERVIAKNRFNEVALPAGDNQDWDKSGWLYGLERPEASEPNPRLQERFGLPVLDNVAAVRDALDIRSRKQLGWLLLATDADDGPYTRFTIPKRSGADRVICAPKWQLRRVQQQILHSILYRVTVHSTAHGFVPGRSTVTNAEPHVGSDVIIKFDLEDFFPTIHHYRVVGLFASLGYDFSDGRFGTADNSNRVAPTLARLCMYTPAARRFGHGFLPQGAPSSPAITNLICRTLDARLSGLATKNGGRYTRYADDLTFSFPDDAVQIGRFRWWVDQVCHQEGFTVNQSKFRVIRRSQRQSVTGIVVNDSLRVPRRERRRFRAILHNCQVHGVESQMRGRPGFRGWLRGFASYMHMVHPEEGTELLKQVNELLGPDSSGASNE